MEGANRTQERRAQPWRLEAQIDSDVDRVMSPSVETAGFKLRQGNKYALKRNQPRWIIGSCQKDNQRQPEAPISPGLEIRASPVREMKTRDACSDHGTWLSSFDPFQLQTARSEGIRLDSSRMEMLLFVLSLNYTAS